MKTTIRISAIALAFMAFTGCKEVQKKEVAEEHQEVETEQINDEGISEVITKEQQSALTPDGVIQSFKEGNKRFVNNNLTTRNESKQVSNSAAGQYPEAVVLSCIDSRIPVEIVFDRGIGDLFVARVAGNFANEDILGSMEFACKVSGAKLVLVMGHQSCGAIRAAVDDVKLGNITPMLKNIRPAVDKVDYDGDRTSGNPEFVEMANESNVKNTLAYIRKNSPILKEMEDNGEIKIVGAVYNLENGKVDWLN